MDSEVWQVRRTSRQTIERKPYEIEMAQSISRSTRVDGALHAVVENQLNQDALTEGNNSVLERNRALLQYVATLANSNKKNDEFNYEFVQSLINGGADINITDQHGQSLFHEVARSWNVDVAKFLLENGGRIDRQDNFGRTPLHVAASVDFVEMTEFLLKNKANIDARTFGELQAPIHYAAKNGAVGSLKVLLGYKANIDSVDYRQRTPLQLAAQWTRDKTAKVLISEGASSWLLDSAGNSALSVLIDRLPERALEALNQLHSTDTITTTESYYLNFLESSRMKLETTKARTSLEEAVVMRKYEVVTHPVIKRLIDNKWKQFGRLSTIRNMCFYVVFNIMWTTMSVLTPPNGRELYSPLGDNIWRVILLILICIMIFYQVWHQIKITRKTITAQNHWVKWKNEELQEDLAYCHPRWPQEENAVRYQIKQINKKQRFPGTDAWFYYDWIVIFLMLSAITAHFVYYKLDITVSRDVYTRIISVVNLVVWLRLLDNVRPFPGIGTLVTILGETIGDFVNWMFLFILLFIPFSSAFWIIFGGISVKPVPGYQTTESLIYSVFRMAVGDEFNFEGLAEADPVMSRILTVIYITAVTIVTLNLLIALLTDTFTRVHGNAIANTIMQRAITVINAERALSKKGRLAYREHMKNNCSPEVVKMVIKIGTKDSLTKSAVLHQNLATVKQVLDDRFADVYGRNKMSDFEKIKTDVGELAVHQNRLYRELEQISELLQEIRDGGEGQEGKRKGRKEKHRGPDGRKTGRNDRSAKTRSLNSAQSSDKMIDTSIVPYNRHEVNPNQHENLRYSFDNAGFNGSRSSDSEQWEKASLDSISL